MENKHRIRYKTSEAAAAFDKAIFQKWEDRIVTTEQARRELELSVGQPISTEIFVINANWLGYQRKQ